MVGSAQYRDDEIGWILAAVVAKKKQDFIKRHFEERFGRPLNHNQIRYIKNKYGKDPRFNSPLINIRPCAGTASSSGSPDSNDSDEIVPIPTIPLPEIANNRIYYPQRDGQAKRKRVLQEDEGYETRRVRVQRESVQSDSDFDHSRVGVFLPNVPRWDPMGPRLASSMHSLLPPLATPRASHGQVPSMYEISQQLVQGIGSLNWAFPKDGSWTFDECSNLIDASSHQSPTASENVTPSPVELSRSSKQVSTSSVMDTPLGGNHSFPHIPRSNPSIVGSLQFSPTMSPINQASHTSPMSESLLISSINGVSSSSSSMPFANPNQGAFFSSTVTSEMGHQRPLHLQPPTADSYQPIQGWNNQEEVSGFCPSSPDRKGPMAWGSCVAPSTGNASCLNQQAVFPMQLPVSSHFGNHGLFANYISSPGASAYSQLPSLTLHHSLPTVSEPCHAPWMLQNAHGASPAASNPGDSRDVRGFGWQLRDAFAAKTHAQGVASPVSKPVARSVAGIESGMFGLSGQGLLQEALMDDAQYTTAAPAGILSSRAAADFATDFGIPARSQRCEEFLDDELIDPSLLGAFELDGGSFGISNDMAISQTG